MACSRTISGMVAPGAGWRGKTMCRARQSPLFYCPGADAGHKVSLEPPGGTDMLTGERSSIARPWHRTGAATEREPPPLPRLPWRFGLALLLAGYLLFAHGCHGDKDNELFTSGTG